VKIDIPAVLVELRGRITEETPGERGERLAMAAMGRILAGRRRYEAAQRAARAGRRVLPLAARLPGPLAGWSMSRELPLPPAQTFREWWRSRS
jgi:L-lactate dehydrogenase complex protein LldF